MAILHGARALLVAGSLVGGAQIWAQEARAQEPATTEHPGPCDASAAIGVGPSLFVVANDEDSTLRVFRRGEPGMRQEFALAPFLGTDKETDIEGATRVGDTVYWITSHGANKNGKSRPARRRLFATQVTGEGDAVALKPLHRPYTGLVDDLAGDPRLREYRLGEAARRPPEAAGGLNIEGLAASPDGRLLIGFRNPIPGGKALIVPLDNPDPVVRGAEKPRLGDPILLDLGGAGVRSMEYSERRRAFLILAGPPNDDGRFRLFRWAGPGSAAAEEVEGVPFGDLNPEAFVLAPDTDEVLLVSDDGGRRVEGKDCKELDASRQRFRTRSVRVP